jgi:hypothetical protein
MGGLSNHPNSEGRSKWKQRNWARSEVAARQQGAIHCIVAMKMSMILRRFFMRCEADLLPDQAHQIWRKLLRAFDCIVIMETIRSKWIAAFPSRAR